MKDRLPFAGQVCLSMIVKNETAVLQRCLESVRPLISSWAIVDTGSSDGTQELVRRLMADLPGELIERPWQDFATGRNQALELAARHGEYALIIDADEIMQIDGTRFPPRLEAAAYYLRQGPADGEFEYQLAKLLKLGIGWRWEGVLHEYPALHPQPAIGLLDGLKIRYFHDGARSQRPLRDKFMDDARVLERALAQEPHNRRYAFYYAQSLRDAGELEAAIAAYRRRADMGGWDQEVWYSLFQIGLLLARQGAPMEQQIDALLRAWEFRPSRAESLCELAHLLRMARRYASARLFAEQAAAIADTSDTLFVDRSVYRWRARDEQAVSAWHLGRHEECARLCRALLADPGLPEAQRARIEANLGFCRGG